ncbi:uncharacterized protein LOC106659219 isoform X1 [Trichogramma pretiosum]|uniref:uncharacterized protein LOC106659219 isoform X1 n=1 Tax=Trichogramma pretiosum TaxID=7493 RepID=UPI0006C9817A|nr:uncharacterized protein LOC106659219 isoform X1 [Trichogramma pretiosum]
MSRCIRSSSRFVPGIIVASSTGCAAMTVRCLGSRHLSGQHASSAFLNQFLSPNSSFVTPLKTREEHYHQLQHATRLPESLSLQQQQQQSFVKSHSDKIDCDASVLRGDKVTFLTSCENYQSMPQGLRQGLTCERLKSSQDATVTTKKTSRQDLNWNIITHRATFFVANKFSDTGSVCFASPAKNTVDLSGQQLCKLQTKEEKRNESNENHNKNLDHIYQTLSVDLPNFFTKSIDYKIYDPHVELVNNIKGTSTKGLPEYVKQAAMLRILGHLKFAFVRLEVLRITMHTQDNTVKVRWRIVGLTGLNVVTRFWKFKVWKIRESVKDIESWHDGFSTFYMNDKGLVYKHVIDKVIPDEDTQKAKPKEGLPTTKLAPGLTFSALENSS